MIPQGCCAIGLDIGKTKIAVGIVGTDGTVEWSSDTKTDMIRGGEAIVSQSLDLIQEAVAHLECDPIGIGVGATGVIDHERGIVLSSGSVRGWSDIKMKEILETEFRWRAAVENDVHAAAYGEHFYGAARGSTSSVYMVISTGVGFSVIVDNKVWHGAHRLSGQIAHLCLFNGETVNDEFSGAGIAARAARELKSSWSTSEVFDRADSGNENAAKLLKNAARAAGTTIAWIQNTVDPEVIVVGGGVAVGRPTFLDQIRMHAAACVSAYASHLPGDMRILSASLGRSAGVVGAAALIALALSKQPNGGPA